MVDEIANALAIQGEIRYGIKTVLADMGYSAATNPDLARAAQAQVEGVLFTQLQRMENDAPIKVAKETLTGENVLVWNNVISLVLPGFAVMFAFFVVPTLSTALLREKADGTLRRLLAAPLPRSSLIGGKVLAYVLVVVVQITILFAIGAIFMDMPLGRSPAGMVLVTVSLGLCATTLGMLVATVSRSIGQAEAIGFLIVFGLGFLSGSMSPVDPPYRGEGRHGDHHQSLPAVADADGLSDVDAAKRRCGRGAAQRVVPAGPVAGLLPDRRVALQNRLVLCLIVSTHSTPRHA